MRVRGRRDGPVPGDRPRLHAKRLQRQHGRWQRAGSGEAKRRHCCYPLSASSQRSFLSKRFIAFVEEDGAIGGAVAETSAVVVELWASCGLGDWGRDWMPLAFVAHPGKRFLGVLSFIETGSGIWMGSDGWHFRVARDKDRRELLGILIPLKPG
ncbi:hypothetical protein CCHR01_12142 [Colletotrichum chrysophilum]|uniref:Uncharacterized protein n=1 Tax=Colletotrichum chrysophilum TaxID=1836956 RepID=A0AAD9EEF8_9PEZI|nr:hypothetical protein CCHR01_12142 [Colletotrichum chrysophilum]